jgi:hypothetical protein
MLYKVTHGLYYARTRSNPGRGTKRPEKSVLFEQQQYAYSVILHWTPGISPKRNPVLLQLFYHLKPTRYNWVEAWYAPIGAHQAST